MFRPEAPARVFLGSGLRRESKSAQGGLLRGETYYYYFKEGAQGHMSQWGCGKVRKWEELVRSRGLRGLQKG